ncbi:hypothetical protein [Luteibacter sp. 3190]|uniref:hypothetical protein n=1 Tax=Luteibacter sp. 3190 TaxID=2817736 RepID=UPI002857CC8C|nr:hypothetical protein [Luteibacter sp. 3190]MDR6935002.1 hypothetical protein [Luteibacter sp. 3190]
MSMRSTDYARLAKRVLAFVDKAVTRYVPIAPRRSVLKGLLRRFVQVAVPGLFLSLAACGGNVEPNIHLNPDPSMRYEITYTVDDPSVVFDSVEAIGSYQVTNEACAPRVPVSGVRKVPNKVIPLTTRPIDRSTYQVTAYPDALLDEDYFGHGVCHWALTATTLVWKRQGKELTSSLISKDMFEGRHILIYYPRSWLRSKETGFAEGGSITPSIYPNRDDLFTISVVAREVRQ